MTACAPLAAPAAASPLGLTPNYFCSDGFKFKAEQVIFATKSARSAIKGSRLAHDEASGDSSIEGPSPPDIEVQHPC
jgi:hypothetical protein